MYYNLLNGELFGLTLETDELTPIATLPETLQTDCGYSSGETGYTEIQIKNQFVTMRSENGILCVTFYDKCGGGVIKQFHIELSEGMSGSSNRDAGLGLYHFDRWELIKATEENIYFQISFLYDRRPYRALNRVYRANRLSNSIVYEYETDIYKKNDAVIIGDDDVVYIVRAPGLFRAPIVPYIATQGCVIGVNHFGLVMWERGS